MEDVRCLKRGERPPTQKEWEAKVKQEQEESLKKRQKEREEKLKEAEDLRRQMAKLQQNTTFGLKDQVIIGCLAVVWLTAILYFNTGLFRSDKREEEVELPVI